MAIIYSYPATAPTLDDLLIGTDVGADNATKSFTVQSLVALVNAAAGNGTVTSVQIATDAFLRATGGPIVDAGVITLSLTATGTPSATTFLRGDNQWVVPTVTSGITISYSNVNVTTDLQSMNFTGAGITVGSDANGNVEITVPGATNGVDSLVQGTGIGLSASTGNVVITNTGITSLIEGTGITIATTAAGQATISLTNQSLGTVTSVNAGPGLLITGTSTVSPVVALDYDGADTYITQPAASVPLEADFIPFHSVASTAVKKVTFGDIQASTLALVNTAITVSDSDSIKNNTDTYTSVPITSKVITLLDSEYIALSPNYDASTLYLTTSTAPTTGTVQFTVISSGISQSDGCVVSVSTTCSPTFTDGTNLTNVAVGTNYVLTSQITAVSPCVFSGTNPQTVSGTVTAGTTPVTQNLTGSVSIPSAAQGGNNLGTIGAISGGTLNTDYTVTPTSGSSTGNLGSAVGSYGVTATITNPAKENTGPANSLIGTQSPATYTSPSSSTSNITFPNAVIATKTFNVGYAVTTSGGLATGKGTTWQLAVSGNTFTGNTLTGSQSGVAYNANTSAYTFQAQAVGINGNTVTGSTPVTANGAITANVSISGDLTGTVSAGAGTVQMIVGTNSISGGSEGADYTMSYTYQIDSGTVSIYNLGDTPSVNINSNIVFVATATAVSGKTINCGATHIAGTANFTMPAGGGAQNSSINLTGAIGTNRFVFQCANIGGGLPNSQYPACNGSTIDAYTDADYSFTGIPVGAVVYANQCGTNNQYFHPANALTYYKAGVSPSNTNGYISFGSGGAVASIALCP